MIYAVFHSIRRTTKASQNKNSYLLCFMSADNEEEEDITALFHSSRQHGTGGYICCFSFQQTCCEDNTTIEELSALFHVNKQHRTGGNICFDLIDQTCYEDNIEQEELSALFRSSRRATKTTIV